MPQRLEDRQLEFSVAFSAFCEILDQIDDKKYDQPGVCGAWSPREVVFHLLGWDRAMEAFIANPECFDHVPLLDFDSFNAQSISDRQHQLWEETLDEMQCGHARLQESIATVSAESKIFERLCEWLMGRKADYEHHTVQLSRWVD